MKYIIILSLLFLTSCSLFDDGLRVGMKVTNGPCVGYIMQELSHPHVQISPANCGDVSFNFIIENRKNLIPVKQ